MRNLKAYTWNEILAEEVPRTFISIELINKENETKEKEMNKVKNKSKPRR